MRLLDNLFYCLRGGFMQLRSKTVKGWPSFNGSLQTDFLLEHKPTTVITSENSLKTITLSPAQHLSVLCDSKYWAGNNLRSKNFGTFTIELGKRKIDSNYLISPTMVRFYPQYTVHGVTIDGYELDFPTDIPNLPHFPTIMPQVPEEAQTDVEPNPKDIDCPEAVDNAPLLADNEPLLFAKKDKKKKDKKKKSKKGGCKKVADPCGKRKKKKEKKKTACDTITDDDPCKPKKKTRCPKVPTPCGK